jgi:hypothetical protein
MPACRSCSTNIEPCPTGLCARCLTQALNGPPGNYGSATCLDCRRTFQARVRDANTCTECITWREEHEFRAPQIPHCGHREREHVCIRPEFHDGMHEGVNGARWNEIIMEEPVDVRFEPLTVRGQLPIRDILGMMGVEPSGPVPEDVVIASGRVMQYEPSVVVRLPGTSGGDTSCPSCQGRRWVGDPGNPQECACATRARPRSVPVFSIRQDLPVDHIPVPFPPPPVGSVVNVGFNVSGVQVGDEVMVNGMPAGRIMAIEGSTVTLDQEGARATANFRPISFERTMREGVRGSPNPCAEIPLGSHEMAPVGTTRRVFQDAGFSELEIATIRHIFGENPFAQGVDPHELTKDLFLNEKGKHEKLVKILQDEYSRNYRRTRFERDDVI